MIGMPEMWRNNLVAYICLVILNLFNIYKGHRGITYTVSGFGYRRNTCQQDWFMVVCFVFLHGIGWQQNQRLSVALSLIKKKDLTVFKCRWNCHGHHSNHHMSPDVTCHATFHQESIFNLEVTNALHCVSQISLMFIFAFSTNGCNYVQLLAGERQSTCQQHV